MKPRTFQAQAGKTKKWNFLALILKKLLYFRKWNPALFSPRSEIKKSIPRKFLILIRKPRKKFLYFLKKVVFVFR